MIAGALALLSNVKEEFDSIKIYVKNKNNIEFAGDPCDAEFWEYSNTDNHHNKYNIRD